MYFLPCTMNKVVNTTNLHKKVVFGSLPWLVVKVSSLIMLTFIVSVLWGSDVVVYSRMQKIWVFKYVGRITVNKFLNRHMCVCLLYCRHWEAWTDLLDEFWVHLQVLQRSPEDEGGRGSRRERQRCHHTQRLFEKQTPGFIESAQHWLGQSRTFSAVHQIGECRNSPLPNFCSSLHPPPL